MLSIDRQKLSKIQKVLSAVETIPQGGNLDGMCSISAIHFGLEGVVDQERTPGMSPAVYTWIRMVQPWIPVELLNHPSWKQLIPFAAATGLLHEERRQQVVDDWLWWTIVPSLDDQVDPPSMHDWRLFGVNKEQIYLGRLLKRRQTALLRTGLLALNNYLKRPSVRSACFAASLVMQNRDYDWWLQSRTTLTLKRLIQVSVTPQELQLLQPRNKK